MAATASCPSRNTVAETGKDSPTTALAGRRPESTRGLTSRTGMRPITVSLSVVVRAVLRVVAGFARARPAAGRAADFPAGAAPPARPVAGSEALAPRAVVRPRGVAALVGPGAVRLSSAPGCRAGSSGRSVRSAPAPRGPGIAASVRASESIRPADSATAASRVSATGVDWSRVSPCMPNSCPRSAAAPAGRQGQGSTGRTAGWGGPATGSLPAPPFRATCPAPAEPVAEGPRARARPGARLSERAPGGPDPPVNERDDREDTRRSAMGAEWTNQDDERSTRKGFGRAASRGNATRLRTPRSIDDRGSSSHRWSGFRTGPAGVSEVIGRGPAGGNGSVPPCSRIGGAAPRKVRLVRPPCSPMRRMRSHQ